MKTLALALALGLSSTAFASDTTHFNPHGTNKPKQISLKIDDARTLVLRGVVMPGVMDQLDNQFKELAKDSSKPIYLIIDSPGGSIDAGMQLIDTMLGAKRDKGVYTICVIENKAFSMGAVIASFCHATYATVGSSLLFHEASYQIQGPASKNLTRAIYFTKQLDNFNELIAKQLKMPLLNYLDAMIDEWWIPAPEAVAIGLINGITTPVFYTNKTPDLSFLDVLLGNDNKLWFEYTGEKLGK